MVFNSFAYFVFFLTILTVYYATPLRFRWMVILCGSYFFYMSWNPAYGLLLFSTTFMSWVLVRLMVSKPRRTIRKRTIFVTSIVLNLGALFLFKYFDFVSTSFWTLFKYANEPLLIELLLPIGISFYTFQSLAYVIDVYRGDLPPERNFFRYATFISFFPPLVSGPILRPANILPQVHEEKVWNSENLKIGLFYIATGIVKKLIIADRIGVFVDQIYLQPELYSGATLLVATYLFAFQIYCDFSGYTDIAIGSARILGYTIPDNFRQPYLSQSVTEFWRRWHISLSSWFRDYLYIPLGGNRKGEWRTYGNLLITMILAGIWHGAAGTFIIFGALHGLYLVTERLLGRFKITMPIFSRLHVVPIAFRVFLTFNFVALAWIFFRAASIGEALHIVGKIVGDFGVFHSSVIPLSSLALYGVMICGLLVFDYLEMKRAISQKILAMAWPYRWALAYAVIFSLIFFGSESGGQFIYFQF